MADHPDMSPPAGKRAREDPGANGAGEGGGDDTDRLIAQLRTEIASLRDREAAYYASNDCLKGRQMRRCIPESGSSARHVKERIVQTHELGTFVMRPLPIQID
jgi:hypothetical protein